MDVLDQIMGVNDAAKRWNLAPGTIKNYCAEGRVKARKIDGRWIIDKNQPNPSQPMHPNNWRSRNKESNSDCQEG